MKSHKVAILSQKLNVNLFSRLNVCGGWLENLEAKNLVRHTHTADNLLNVSQIGLIKAIQRRLLCFIGASQKRDVFYRDCRFYFEPWP